MGALELSCRAKHVAPGCSQVRIGRSSFPKRFPGESLTLMLFALFMEILHIYNASMAAAPCLPAFHWLPVSPFHMGHRSAPLHRLFLPQPSGQHRVCDILQAQASVLAADQGVLDRLDVPPTVHKPLRDVNHRDPSRPLQVPQAKHGLSLHERHRCQGPKPSSRPNKSNDCHEVRF